MDMTSRHPRHSDLVPLSDWVADAEWPESGSTGRAENVLTEECAHIGAVNNQLAQPENRSPELAIPIRLGHPMTAAARCFLIRT